MGSTQRRVVLTRAATARARRGLTGAALGLAVACGSAPASLEDCGALPDAAEREACHYTFIRPLLDDPAALDAALATIEDPGSRDLLLLRLAIADPQRAGKLCARVATAGAQERCRQVLGRPHLQSVRRPPTEPGGPAAPAQP